MISEKASTGAPSSTGNNAGGHVFVIFNPASWRGRGAERQQAYIKLLHDAEIEFELWGLPTEPTESTVECGAATKSSPSR